MDNSTYSESDGNSNSAEAEAGGRVRRHAGAEQPVEGSKRVSRAGRRARLRLHSGGKDGATPEQMVASQRREKDLERVRARRAARQEVVAAEKLETGIPAQILRDAGIGANVEKKSSRSVGGGDGWFRPGHDVVYDQDHAAAVLEHFTGDVRYVEETGTWLVRHRKQGVWKDAVGSDVAVARRLLARAANRIPKVGSGVGLDKKAWKDMTPDDLCWLARKRYRSGGGAGAIAGFMTACAGWQNSTWSVSEAELDTEECVLWTPEGPVWLGPGEGSVDLDTPHRKVTAVTPRSGPTPYWDKLLAAVWPDAEIREWALDLLSVGLTGVAEKMFLYFYGPANTAKTSVVELIVGLLGSYGVGDLDSSLVSANAQPWEKIKLKGIRLGLIDEAMPPGRGPTETLKKLTGGAPQSGADKGKKPVTFVPTHTLAFTANPEPGLTDPAVTSRGRLVPCMGDVDEIRAARADLGGVGIWEEEGPGVLWDLVERARRYMADRSRVRADRAPLSLQMQVADLVGEQDVLVEWLDNCTVVDTGLSLAASVRTSTLYDQFSKWCELSKRTNHYLATDKTVSWFGARLGERYGREAPMKRRSATGYVWGLRLVKKVERGELVEFV